jgi:hypothetical protein
MEMKKIETKCACLIDGYCYHDHDIRGKLVKNSCTHMANNKECIGYIDPLSYDGIILKEAFPEE